ncbi:MAG TPA: transcriptional regulator [Porphyromonadaceae bacterium]|nr:transcriptional regulator [Porphyromonadaceae bacterium]
MKFTILIIDDEKNIREGLAANFEMEDYNVKTASTGEEGLELISKGDIDLVITDLRMPGITGEQVLAKVTAETPGIPVIILTGHGSIDSAVDAMRHGAYDFLTKPLNLDQLDMIVKRALESREMSLQHQQLKKELEGHEVLNNMIGKSAAMQKVQETIRKVADSRASVLITGESGVGKELVADAIHKLSSRKDNSFIKVHCAALSETLLESELFGHEKGSFTGALADRKGYFEVSNGGTIFLDEVGELPLSTQARLLRVLETGEFIKVGSSKVQKTDVRIVAATNLDIPKAIKKGKFREDLYYRLNTVPISVPPLRDRGEDILLLFRKFANDFAEKYRMPSIQLTEDSKRVFLKYRWPGNIRQLKNITEQISIIERERDITPDILEHYLPNIGGSNLPTVFLGEEQENLSFQKEREILYQLIFELRRDVNELKSMMCRRGNKTNSLPTNEISSVLPQTANHEVQSIELQSPSSKPSKDKHKIEEAESYEEETISLEEMEKEMIKRALERHKGNRRNAAQELKISERTLYRKIKDYNLE